MKKNESKNLEYVLLISNPDIKNKEILVKLCDSDIIQLPINPA